jgi:hypothetical protein
MIRRSRIMGSRCGLWLARRRPHSERAGFDFGTGRSLEAPAPKTHQRRFLSQGGGYLREASVNGCFRQLQAFRGRLLEHGARFWIGRHFCQLQTMGGVADVALSVVD